MRGGLIIYGELLFDIFPSGEEVLGGAAFNVAWHLKGLGMDALLMSRIGKDERGVRVKGLCKEWGLDMSGIKEDEIYPTGTAILKVNKEGKAEYELKKDQAYDFINENEYELIEDWIKDFGLIYHGSLIQRGISKRGLNHLIKEGGLKVFIDLNLRDPWWDRGLIEKDLKASDWCKMNEEELGAISGQELNFLDEQFREAKVLSKKYNIHLLMITLGEKGVFMIEEGELITYQKVEGNGAGRIVDTVGAGDALSAIFLLGIMKSWSTEKILKTGVEFSQDICSIKGAISFDRSFYEKYQEIE